MRPVYIYFRKSPVCRLDDAGYYRNYFKYDRPGASSQHKFELNKPAMKNKEKKNALTGWIIIIALALFVVWGLTSCNSSQLPYDPEITETDPADSFEISEPALHPDCANNPGAIDPVDLWGKDEISEIVYRIDSIDQANMMVWAEPVWSETGQTVCTGNEWRWYGGNEFTIACKETLEPYVHDTCGV